MRFRCLVSMGGVAAMSGLLSGCMVGPKYTKPSVPMAPTYKEGGPGAFKEPPTDPSWQTAKPADEAIRGDWWSSFGDPELSALEVQVASANQDLRAAEARFREARSAIGFNRAGLYPTIGVAPFVGAERVSANRPYFNSASANNGVADLQLPLDFSYELDFWGRVRHNISAAREEAQASAGDLQTAMLSVEAELAVDYFEARSADAEKKLLDDTVRQYEEALRVTNNRFEGGVAGKSDVSQAETQLEAAKVQASDITVRRAQYEHAIAVLTGQPPASFALASAPLAAQPPAIPPGLPSQLLERRPDIAAAERRVAEANDRIGVARAAFFPTVNLSGLVGLEGTSALNVLDKSSFIWAVGPTLSQTVFDAGRRRATSGQTGAAYDQTVASYRQTTLIAFQQVEDNLAVLRVLSDEAQQQQRATAAAREAEQIFNNRYVGGVDTYLQVITAQTIALNNQRNDIDIMRRRMDASVLLIKALGGGWNVANLPRL